MKHSVTPQLQDGLVPGFQGLSISLLGQQDVVQIAQFPLTALVLLHQVLVLLVQDLKLTLCAIKVELGLLQRFLSYSDCLLS